MYKPSEVYVDKNNRWIHKVYRQFSTHSKPLVVSAISNKSKLNLLRFLYKHEEFEIVSLRSKPYSLRGGGVVHRLVVVLKTKDVKNNE